MFSSSSEHKLSDDHRNILLRIAASSIEHGLKHRRPPAIIPSEYPSELRTLRATFVTLEIGGALRGCIGTLEAMRPLVVDVAENAFAAAFREYRFPPVRDEEYTRLEIHISILHTPVPVGLGSEETLSNQLRRGVDGLILQEGVRRGTLLPSAWDTVPNPAEFVRHVKRKAGLPDDYWSETLKAWRYTVESFPSP